MTNTTPTGLCYCTWMNDGWFSGSKDWLGPSAETQHEELLHTKVSFIPLVHESYVEINLAYTQGKWDHNLNDLLNK